MAKRGFSLIELVVTISIIVILTGVITPLVGNMIEEARVNRATAEVKVLAEAIINLYKDTVVWPADASITTTAAWNVARNKLFVSDTIPAKIWKGPYLAKQVGLDPWGIAYHYNRGTISGVMSYGPNKQNNLSFNQRQAQVDDIVYYIQ